MILHQNNSQITRGGIAGEKAFSIKLSSKMYSILTDGLYSDKIGSVVREVSCNAYDSHIQAGKSNIPFKVSLPTSLEPHFVVEDFGTGLPDEKCQELYSTLGLSTKEDSNDVIGAFGLGSKAPLAVTDSFTIENTYDGKTFYYMCFKNEEGMPTILKTGEVDTTKENGIKVIIPAPGWQYNDYHSAMRRQLIFMEPKPIITNIGGVELGAPTILVENEHGFLLDNCSTYGLQSQRYYAKMGIVVYPIDSGVIRCNTSLIGYNTSAILKFDIGELDPLPSREGLSYDKMTIEAIKNRIEAFEEEIIKGLIEEVENETSFLDAYRKTLSLDQLYRGNMASRNFEINGTEICFNYNINFPTFEKDVIVPEYTSWNGSVIPEKTVKQNKTVFSIDQQYSSYRRSYYKNNTHSDLSHTTWSTLDNIDKGDITVVLVDEDPVKNKNRKYKKVMEEYGSGYNNYVWFVHLNKESGETDFSEFISRFDKWCPDLSKKFLKISEVVPEKIIRVKAEDGEMKGVNYYRYDYSYEETLKSDVDLDADKCFFVKTERYKPVDYVGLTDTRVFKDFATNNKLMFINLTKSGARYEKVLNEAGILEFKDFVKKFLDEYEPTQELIDFYTNRTILESTTYQERNNVQTLLDHSTRIPEYFDLMNERVFKATTVEFEDEETKMFESIRKSKLVEYFQDDNLKSTFVDGETVDDFKQKRQEFMEKMEMMNNINSVYYYDGPTKYNRYVDQMIELHDMKYIELPKNQQTTIEI